MTSIPVPILVLPWLLAGAAWLAFPWLARRIGRPAVLRWVPPGLVVIGGAMLWLSSAGEPAGGHDARATSMRTAASGLCLAAASLPTDRDEAVRAFTNRAHEPLHALAADPDLPRADAAALLRAKEAVEARIAEGAPADALVDPVDELRTAFATAIDRIGIEVDPCDR